MTTIPRFQVVLAQLCLLGIGLYDGLADGDLGEQTRDAIRAFQTEIRHLEVTGRLDPETWGALCQAGELALTREQRSWDDMPEEWPELPEELLSAFDELAQLCVQQEVSYGPGRGWYDEEVGGFVATQGPFGLDSARFKTRDRVYLPAFVCSTFTYFVAAYLTRMGPVFNSALAGGQPPIWDVLMGEQRIHPASRMYGPWHGFGGLFRPVLSTGSSGKRHAKARRVSNRMDLLEVFERLDEVPELMLGGWASRKGYIHHTACLRVDRLRRELRFVDAGGWKSNGVFSGTDMDITTIASPKEAAEAATRGWGRWYGFWPGDELLLALSQEAPRLGFETAPGEVTWLGGGA